MRTGWEKLLFAGLIGFLGILDGDSAAFGCRAQSSGGSEAWSGNDAIFPVGVDAGVVQDIIDLDRRAALGIEGLLAGIRDCGGQIGCEGEGR